MKLQKAQITRKKMNPSYDSDEPDIKLSSDILLFVAIYKRKCKQQRIDEKNLAKQVIVDDIHIKPRVDIDDKQVFGDTNATSAVTKGATLNIKDDRKKEGERDGEDEELWRSGPKPVSTAHTTDGAHTTTGR